MRILLCSTRYPVGSQTTISIHPSKSSSRDSFPFLFWQCLRLWFFLLLTLSIFLHNMDSMDTKDTQYFSPELMVFSPSEKLYAAFLTYFEEDLGIIKTNIDSAYHAVCYSNILWMSLLGTDSVLSCRMF